MIEITKEQAREWGEVVSKRDRRWWVNMRGALTMSGRRIPDGGNVQCDYVPVPDLRDRLTTCGLVPFVHELFGQKDFIRIEVRRSSVLGTHVRLIPGLGAQKDFPEALKPTLAEALVELIKVAPR